jgi:hypothetical protein
MSLLKAKHPSLALDLLFVVVAASLVFLAGRFGAQAGHPPARGLGAIFGGVCCIYLGVLFLLSYFFPETSYILNFMRYVCEECSHPAGRHMALVYFAMSLVFGAGLLLIGLGVF